MDKNLKKQLTKDIYASQIRTQKYAGHHQSFGKCKLKPQAQIIIYLLK